MPDARVLQTTPALHLQPNLFLKQKQASDSKKEKLGEHNFFYKGQKPTDAPVTLTANV
jgi:hypothetical protein